MDWAAKGEKALEFTNDGIVVKVRHSGEFTEIVPLLERGGESSAAGFAVKVDSPSTSSRLDTNTEIGRRRDSLTYRLQFAQ